MGFSVSTSLPALTVFLQGILSFFSPCVLPLVPLYLGYLSGGTKTVGEDGQIRYHRGKVLLHTAFFVLGVSFVFFILGFGFTAAGRFFTQYQTVFTKAGGVLVILFGLYQLGLFGASKLLGRERRLPFRLDRLAMGPIAAFLMGFTFSFAWTPCVGPALASVLLMASSSASAGKAALLIGLYTLGFVLPFLAVGLFTSRLLEIFRKHQKVVQYTVKIGGGLMVLMGVMMLTGWMNGMSSYLSQGGVSNLPNAVPAVTATPSVTPETAAPSASALPQESKPAVQSPAPDFTLKDQFGNEHTLSDYKGKTVFLNFWATWCPPCKAEMPDIQALYEDWEKNAGDVIILGVAQPNTDGSTWNKEGDEAHVKDFLSENGYEYPVLMDLDSSIFSAYGIQAFPSTFMISADGAIFGYVQGGISREMMDSIVEQTISGQRVEQSAP